MTKINVIIIDDEKDSRETIGQFLQDHFPSINVVAEANSVESGISVLNSNKIDLLFLDIQLKNKLSFEILEKLEIIDFNIIFITAYNHYAIKAIKIEALDYILKPIERKEFISSVNKAIEKIKTKKVSKSIDSLLSKINDNKKNQIKIPTLSGFKIINTNDIIWLKSEGSYTKFHLTNKETILVSQNLKIYEDLLPPSIFCRIHNSHIVNVNFIIEYIKGRGGQVVLSDKTLLSVSKNKKNLLLEIWN